MNDGDVDEKSLGKWQQLQHCKSTMSYFYSQGMTNYVRSAFSVGDTI
jgi:hypothetical protein